MTALVWLTGPPGVGKSTVAWTLFRRAADRGERVAYVDIDQLGMLLPARDDDPGAHRLKLRNLRAVAAAFGTSGVHTVFVSGVVDPDADAEPDALLVRLVCTTDELSTRYRGRGLPIQPLADVHAYAAALERNPIGVPLDTTGATAAAVAEAVEDLVASRPARDFAVEAAPRGRVPPTTLVVGPTAVGKSTIAWQSFQTLGRRGVPTAFVDADQLGFTTVRPAVATTKAANLTELVAGFGAADAAHMIVVGGADSLTYRDAVTRDGGTCTVVRLDADGATLRERIAHRAAGGGPPLAGDPLRGLTPGEQEAVSLRAAAERAREQSARADERVLDTTGRTVADSAAELTRLILDRRT